MKGAELDKQIYPEGEPTWGCKSGVLDVEDVKESIKTILKKIDKEERHNQIDADFVVDLIKEEMGDKLI